MTININEVPTSIPTVSGDDLVAQVEAARDAAIAAAEFRSPSMSDFLSRSDVTLIGSRWRIDTGEVLDVVAAGAGDYNHPVSGIGLSVVPANGVWPLAAFGASEDGGVTDDTDAWVAAIEAFKTSPHPIRIKGFSRITAPLLYQTMGTASGINIEGINPEECGIIGDFDGDYLLGMDGSSLLKYAFQHYGGLKNLTLKVKPGRAIKNSIQSVGWWRPRIENVTIGVGGDASQGFTEDGIHIPLRSGIDANPDAYASVLWTLDRVRVYNCGGSGIKGANTAGHAGWNLQDCTFEQNANDGIEVHANNWRSFGGSCSYNGRYGINYSGESGSTLTGGLFVGTELDGNVTANIYVERVNSGTFLNPRLISRLRDDVETALSHVKINNAHVCSGLKVINPFHRVDPGITSHVTLYDAGTAISNIAGNKIDGARVLDNGSGGYTVATDALTDLRYRNEVTDNAGRVFAAGPLRVAHQSFTSQAITTTLTTWKFDTDVQPLWLGVYDTSTGIFTMPYRGAIHLSVSANVNAPGAGERIRLLAYKNGALARHWYWDWKSGAEPDRINIAVSEIFVLRNGDTLDLRVDSTSGTLTLQDTGCLSIVGL